jgi:quinoprotein dehydrogenase-associated probable ABC transporter substrate-binding protein
MARTGSRACLAALLLGPLLLEYTPSLASAQGNEPTLELIDPQVLRVCADPHNLPFSNEQGEGFENKLAQLLAAKLGKKLAYTFFPQATGFVRNTLGAHKCDVIMGFPQGDELVQNTNAYYRTAYALIFKSDTGLDDVTQLSDERLKGKRIGIVAGTPAATYLAINGLMGRARPYQLMVDTRVDSSAVAMVSDLEKGEIDAGVLWGPMAGYYGRKASLRVVPLVKETGGPRTVYRITMGVRAADQNWKRTLNRFIQENQADISKIMLGYGVPLLDERDQPITEQNLSTRP